MEKKNVLLLSMSTLPQYLKIQKYYFKEDECDANELYGYSQLEPITKLLIHKLKEKGDKLDRIVIMTSKEALETVHKIASCPAVPFYIQRINEFVSARDSNLDDDKMYFERLSKEKEEWELANPNSEQSYRISKKYSAEIEQYLQKYTFSGD